MGRTWLSGLTRCDADDTFRSIVASAIEIDGVTCCASDFLFFAGRAHMIHYHCADGGCDGDVDADVRGIVPHHCPRYYSSHRGACGGIRCSDYLHLHLHLALKFWPHGLALDDASPRLHRLYAVALSDGELRSLGHYLNLWAWMTVHRYHVYFEDVLATLRLP